jgi:hypothetical protein
MTVITRATDLQTLADELDGKIRAICGIVRTSNMAIGWYARLMRENNVWPLLGFDSEREYLEDRDIPVSSWYFNVQLAEGYKRLDRDTYMSLRPSKAYAMLDLPEAERVKPGWLALAADPDVTVKEVVGRIELHFATNGAHDVTCRQERGTFRCRMDLDAKELVEEVLKQFCAQHGLGDNLGRALELLIVDANWFGAAVMKVIRDRLDELKATVELLKNADRPAEERCAVYEKQMRRFIVELGKACSRAETVQ